MNPSQLPWPREQTFSYGDTSVISSTLPVQYLGKEYWVEDTVHNLGQMVKLKVVKNHTATAITINNVLVFFRTGSGDMGRMVGKAAAQGAPALPIDDALVNARNGKTIPAYDLFYVVCEGPCYVDTSTGVTTTKGGVGTVVCADAKSRIDETGATDGDYVIGVMDEAFATAGATKRVLVGKSMFSDQAG